MTHPHLQHPNSHPSSDNAPLNIRTFMQADYETTHAQMLELTLARIDNKKKGVYLPDELWVVEHNDVYTLGQAGKEEHILQRNNTPIVQTDRGGQVTWHGKGQLVVYWLFDLNRLGWSVRDLVSHAEQSIEDVLNEALKNLNNSESVTYIARARSDAPGVYIYSQKATNETIMLGKIASLGFKIKQGFSFHGIALNLNCDLRAFNAINPCGYAGMQMLTLADFAPLVDATSTTTDNPSKPLIAPKIKGLEQIPNSVSNHLITRRLILNIICRHAGDTPLRLAPPSTSPSP